MKPTRTENERLIHQMKILRQSIEQLSKKYFDQQVGMNTHFTLLKRYI